MEWNKDEFCIERETSPSSPYFNQDKLVKYNGSAKKVVVPAGVAEIADMAFAENNEIEEVVLPDSVRCIGRGAFVDCKNLKKIHLPEGLRVIDGIAFYGCVSLEEANVPQNAGFVVETAFVGCEKLQEAWRSQGLCILCGHKLNKGLFKNTCPRCHTNFKKS